jgi:hypothetical protein
MSGRFRFSGHRSGRVLRATAAGLVALLATGGAAAAATSEATVTVTSGPLALTSADFQGVSAALTGDAQVVSATPASPWTAIDARGTGAPWSIVASASDLVSAGAPARVIPSARLAITAGPLTPGAGADPAAGISGAAGSAFTVPTGAGQTNVSLLSAAGPHRGSYDFTPRLDITIPAAAQPSYPGVPYAATLTLTIS